MESPPPGQSSVFPESRIPIDGGSLDEDSYTDMWADVAEASHKLSRDIFSNNHVKHKKSQQVKSQPIKGRNDPRKQHPGESHRGSLSPRRHSGSPCGGRSKDEHHRKGVVPTHRTSRSSESPAHLHEYRSLSRTRKSRSPRRHSRSPFGERSKNEHHRKGGVPTHRTSRSSESPAPLHEHRSSSRTREMLQRRPAAEDVSHLGENKNVSNSRAQHRRISTSMAGDDCYKRGHDSQERFGGLQRMNSMRDTNRARQVSTTFDHHKKQNQTIKRVQSCAAPNKPLDGCRRRKSMSDIATREDRVVREKIKLVFEDKTSSGKERNGIVVGPDKKRVDIIELPVRRYTTIPRRNTLPGNSGLGTSMDDDDCCSREKNPRERYDGLQRRNSMRDINRARQINTTSDQPKQQSQTIRRDELIQNCAALDKPRSEKPMYDRLISRWWTSKSDNTAIRKDRGQLHQEDPVREQTKTAIDGRKRNNKERNGAVKGPTETRVDTIELPARHRSTARRKRNSLSNNCESIKERSGAVKGPDEARVVTVELPARPRSSAPHRRNSLPNNYDSIRNVDEQLRQKSSIRSSPHEVDLSVPNDVAEAIPRQPEAERRTRQSI